MIPERSDQVIDLFNEAIKLPAPKREAYLLEACAGDEELRREVAALLPYHEEESEFLESSPINDLDASPPVSGQQVPAGYLLGHYSIISKIGDGGMGEVYRARDTKLPRDVAIKILPAHLSQGTQRIRRFKNEASAASQLNHPNIPIIHELGEESGLHYIVMEFLEGQDLRKKLSGSTLGVNETLAISKQVADALEAAHAADIVHRDIKPENIMLLPNGKVKVLDFGIAKLLQPPTDEQQPLDARDSRRTSPGLVLGTPGYMSPEQANGRGVDTRTDIFSLGVIIYEMLTGQLPPLEKITSDLDSLLFPSNNQLAIPQELSQLIHTALQLEPDRRQQNVSELLKVLEELIKPPSPPPPPPPLDDTPNPLLSEWSFSPRLQKWLRNNPNGGKLAFLTASIALIAILLSRYVGAACIQVNFQPQCDPLSPPIELIFGYLIEFNAGLFYLVGAPLIVLTGFQLLKFAHIALQRLVSTQRLVLRNPQPDANHTTPFAVIGLYNRRLFWSTAPIFVLFALLQVGVPEYLGMRQIAFGWVQALYVGDTKGLSYSNLREQNLIGKLPLVDKVLHTTSASQTPNSKCESKEIIVKEVIHGHSKDDRAKWQNKFLLFLGMALGVQMAFIFFALWIAAKIVFLFVLLIRLLLDRLTQRLKINLFFEDKKRQFGLSALNPVYTCFLMMIVLIAMVFNLSIIANVSKGTSFFGGLAGWPLIGQGLLIGIGFLALLLLTLSPALIFFQLLTSAVKHYVDEIEAKELPLERRIQSESNKARKEQLETELAELQNKKSLAQEQRPWPNRNSLYRRLLMASIVFLFVLPIAVQRFEMLEENQILSSLIVGFARFLCDLC